MRYFTHTDEFVAAHETLSNNKLSKNENFRKLVRDEKDTNLHIGNVMSMHEQFKHILK